MLRVLGAHLVTGNGFHGEAQACFADSHDGSGLLVKRVEGILEISGGTFNNNCDNGIHVLEFFSGHMTTVSNNMASGNGFGVDSGGNGIELDSLASGTVTLDNNTVTGNNDDGADIKDGSGVEITVSGGSYSDNINGDEGIDLDGSDPPEPRHDHGVDDQRQQFRGHRHR